MRISTSGFFQTALNQMLGKQSALSHTQQQLASGKKLLTPADNPPGAAQALRIDNKINVYEQYQENIMHAESRLFEEESVTGTVINHLQRVRELTVQGLNGSLGLPERNSIAFEVEGLLNEIVALANSTDASGEFLFAGYQGGDAPFSHDGLGNFSYTGDDGERSLRINDSSYVQTNDSGNAVFNNVVFSGGGVRSVFATVYDVMSDLRANTPNSVSLTDLDNAIDHLGAIRAEVGARLNVLESAADLNASVIYRLSVDLSQVRDLDYAEAISRFTQQSTALEASQKAFLKIQDLSLFKYI